MGLFNKKNGGLMDVIRCDEPSYLIWKWHPQGSVEGNNSKENAIRWGSALRVKDGAVAVFVYNNNGENVTEYIQGPADCILDTENLPIISNIVGLAYSGGSPFQAEIYFINMAQIIQQQFAVPYFDVFDPRFIDYAVPTAVRGTISFYISDYKHFIRLHQLASFSLDDFYKQVKDAVSRYVKNVVTNAPEDYNIPVMQLERRIEEINDLVESKIRTRFFDDFGVTVSGVDIAVIDIDKSSDGYIQLKAVTQDLTTQEKQTESEVKRKDLKAMQMLGVFQKATQAISEATTGVYEKILHTQTTYSEAAESNRAGRLGAAGAKIIGAFRKKDKQENKGINVTPPPIPTISYYVAENGQSCGPFDLTQLKNMIETKQLTKESLVWKEGMDKWVAVKDEPTLKALFPEIPPIPEQ